MNLPKRGEDKIVEKLTTLNDSVEKQNSLFRIFVTGVIWGTGFVIGSAVLAAVLLGLFLPYIQDIPWVRDLYISGAALIGK